MKVITSFIERIEKLQERPARESCISLIQDIQNEYDELSGLFSGNMLFVKDIRYALGLLHLAEPMMIEYQGRMRISGYEEIKNLLEQAKKHLENSSVHLNETSRLLRELSGKR
jgi:hypothetical protein